MGEVLSDTEINELIKAISTDSVSSEDFINSNDARTIRFYDFLNPPTFTFKEKNLAESVLQTIEQHLAETVSLACGTPLVCSVSELSEISRYRLFSDFLSSHKKRKKTEYLIGENSGEYKAYLISDSSSTFASNTNMLTGSEDFSSLCSDFYNILSLQNDGISADFKVKTSMRHSALYPYNYSPYSFNNAKAFRPTVDRNYNCSFEGKKDMCLTSTLHFKSSDPTRSSSNKRYITLALSYNLIELLCNEKSDAEQVQDWSKNEEDLPLPSFADKVMVDISVAFSRIRKSLNELRRIDEGTIIELPELAGDPVTIYAGGTPIALGEIIIVDALFGIRIIEML